MNKKKILQHNPPEFLEDFKKASECGVWTGQSTYYFKVLKKDVAKMAENEKVNYRISHEIYKAKRIVMIIE